MSDEKKFKVKIRYTNGKPRKPVHWVEVYCEDCEQTGMTSADTEDHNYDFKMARCSQCGSEKVVEIKDEILVHAIDRSSERYPYYDRGLGVMLKSGRHRREICRTRNLTPVEGDFDVSSLNKSVREAEARDEAVLRDMKDKFDNHPGYAEYRRRKDRGWKPNFKHRKRRA
jgi:hypothetical protein